jgi:peroxin-6
VQVKVDEALDDLDDNELPDHPILLPPILLHNLFQGREDSQSTLGVVLTPIPSGHRLPALPSATSLTLARVASPQSLEKRFEPAFNRSLRAFFEDSRGKCRRLLRNGDVIAVSVPEIPVDTRDGQENEVEEQTTATMWVELYRLVVEN